MCFFFFFFNRLHARRSPPGDPISVDFYNQVEFTRPARRWEVAKRWREAVTYGSVLAAALSSAAEKSMHLFRFVICFFFFFPSEFDLGDAGEKETRFLLRHHAVLYERRFIYCCCGGVFLKPPATL